MSRRLTSTGLRVTTLVNGTPSTAAISLSQMRRDQLAAELARHNAATNASRLNRELIEESAIEVGKAPSDYEESGPINRDQSDSETDEDISPPNSTGDNKPSPNDLRGLFKMSVSTRRKRRHDQRTRRERNRSLHERWTNQLSSLIDSYLLYLSSNSSQPSTVRPPTNATPNSTVETQALPVHQFHIVLIGVREYDPQRVVPQQKEEYANVALLRLGYLGATPSQPRIAFTLELLELYHQMRRHQASFSVQTIMKVLCSLHNITYTTTLRSQFSGAFDAYLEILRQTDQRLMTHLQRDDVWKAKYSCPACGWKCANEIPLKPARLHAMDGNNSLKRIEAAGVNDERDFVSRYFISHDTVEKFKNQSHSSKKKKENSTGVNNAEVDGSSVEPSCADNWTTASTVSEETTKIFDQTGIFISVCRHGLVEFIAEMRKSGELAKYGLAVVDQQLEVYGADQGDGYDIGCNFEKTVASSCLAQKAKDNRLEFTVDSFHGHAHNRACQVRYLPLYRNGFGIEDFSTCERVFSASNSAARLVRYSSHFHWRQFIDLHFKRWDAERHEDLGQFILGNYRQALDVIATYTPSVDALKEELKLVDEDFITWHAEEREYLKTVTSKQEYDKPEDLRYVKLLEEYYHAENVYNLALNTSAFFVTTPHDYRAEGGVSAETKKAAALERQERATLQRQVELKLQAVANHERLHQIAVRWLSTNTEYQRALNFAKNETFTAVVQRLEGLVVQRLMELTKANLAETGYKLRKHIATAITRRSATLRKALDRYNTLAPLQHPPRPIVAYSDVISYTVLGEFDFLKCSQSDILAKPWAITRNREIAAKYFKIQRAHEEIVRLNVETRRLEEWATYEDAELTRILQTLPPDAASLRPALEDFRAYRKRVNTVHRQNLNKIYALRGYNGHIPLRYTAKGSGERKDDEVVAQNLTPPLVKGTGEKGEEVVDEGEEAVDEGLRVQAALLQDYLEEVHE